MGVTVLWERPLEAVAPKCLEHNAIRRVDPADLASLDWAAADARCYLAVQGCLAEMAR